MYLGVEAGVGKLGVVALAAVVCAACTQYHAAEPPPISPGIGTDGGNGNPVTPPVDAGPPDSGPPDAGPPPPPPPDGGTIKFGTPGPWPLTNETYGAADGIQEAPVIGVSTDEPVLKDGVIKQNFYVATHGALYVMRPGDKSFRRYDAAAGLHLPGNDEKSCDDVMGTPITPCISPASAASPGISEIVGGGPNEVFVGYYGYHDYSLNENDGTANDPYRHSGQIDRVHLHDDGTIDVVRFQMVSGDSTFFWHNRTIWRMVYDHFIHKHELYAGTDHGVDKFSPDLWQPLPAKHDHAAWTANNRIWMSDHLHAQTCYHHPCGSGESDLRLGDWRGLWLASNGDLWTAGRWAAGEIIWVADNAVWFNRGGASFRNAFGDGYTYCNSGRPVFCVPQEGDTVNLSAVTVTKDPKTGQDKVWFSSGVIYGDPGEVNYGVAAYLQHPGPGDEMWTYFDPVRDIGMAETNVRDMLALPDGRLVLAGPSTGLTIWDPITKAHVSIRAGQGIPSDEVYRLQLDTMVDPPALHVATYGGAAVIRTFPK